MRHRACIRFLPFRRSETDLMIKTWTAGLLAGALLFSLAGSARAEEAVEIFGPFIGAMPVEQESMDSATRAADDRAIAETVRRLRADGRLPQSDLRATVGGYTWPVRAAAALAEYGVYSISNFVDHDARYPDKLQDYACGTRTYDQSNGYNHDGVDIGIWPFAWYRFERNEVEVVAAQAGTIVFKADGRYDRNCAMNDQASNRVYVRHDDGLTAQYLHLKNGSLTVRPVGDRIAQGEYIGVVGSSGSSTAPHLHFEVVDGDGRVVDPFVGACNAGTSRWAVQPAYRDSRINKLSTHSAPAVFPECPGVETPNLSDNFQPGQRIYFYAFYQDPQAGQQATFTVYRPDGRVFASWLQQNATTYNRAYWYWYYTLPTSAPSGTWRVDVVYENRLYSHAFTVGSPAATGATPASGWWWNPNEGGRGFSLEVRNGRAFFAGFLYDEAGAADWVVADGGVANGSFAGTLQHYRAGQTLGGSYQPAATGSSAGTVSLTFDTPTSGVLSWAGGTMPIVRYGFASPAVTAPATGSPEAGWWWTPNQGGSGYFMEVQGSQLFLAAYMYRDNGSPVWYTSNGAMASTTLYEGDLTEFAGGQPMSGTYRPPTASTPMGRIAVQFTSTTTGTLTLPNGQKLPIARFSQF